MAFSISDFVTEIDGPILVLPSGRIEKQPPCLHFFFDLQRNKKTELDWEISDVNALAAFEVGVQRKQKTTVNDGYLGSRNDEERSEMRYVMRIAEFSESSNLWTQIAVLG